MSLLRRVQRMTRREIAFRLRESIRTHTERAAVRMRTPRWDRRRLRRVLNARFLDAEGRTALARGDWTLLDARLRSAMRGRPARYVLHPSQADEVRRAVVQRWPQAPVDAAREADRVLAGRYDLLGYTGILVSADAGAIEWQRDPVHGRTAPGRFWADVPYLDSDCGDHKIIWELNRHQHFLRLGRACWLTGDDRYAARIVEEVESWLRTNPPLRGVNWASMLELGFRSLSWVAAIHFLLGAGRSAQAPPAPDVLDTPWLADMCLGLDRQLSHIEAHLSHYFSPNTHLTGEALALYVAGIALPELAGSSRWAWCGRQVLLHEAAVQIGRDGGHIERSTHYHRYTLDFYTLALQTATFAGDHEAATVFRDAVGRLAIYMRAMSDAHGRMPLIGDDDGGLLWPITLRDPRDVRDSLSLAAVLLERTDLAPWDLPEEVFWLAPAEARNAPTWSHPDPVASRVTSQLFPDTGYVVSRTAGGDHLVFDVGPHGFLNGGHAHADALAVTLTLAGRPLLVDPGTATYTMDAALRDRMRSSLLHNTVTFDHRSSALPGGPFRWRTAANARLERWRGNARVAVAEASHDGYAPLGHRRTVVQGSDGWLVVDEALGTRSHHADARWHFDPAWSVQIEDSGSVRATAADGTTAFLRVDSGSVSVIRGAADHSGGWVSPRYGVLVPSTTLSVQRSLGPDDAMFTWIGSGPGPRDLRPLTLTEPGAHGVRLERGDARVVTILGPAGRQRPDAVLTEEGLRTDARLLQYLSGMLTRTVAVIDATRVDTGDEGGLSIVCDRAVDDLFVGFDGTCLEICASRPPSRLRITGPGVGRAERITLNGGEHRATRSGGHDDVTLLASDWSRASLHAVSGGADAPGAPPIVPYVPNVRHATS